MWKTNEFELAYFFQVKITVKDNRKDRIINSALVAKI